jgi:hypothetical protein
MYLELTGRKLWPPTNSLASRLDDASGGRLSRWKWFAKNPPPDSGITYHADGLLTALETRDRVEATLVRANLRPVAIGARYLKFERLPPSPKPPGT